MKNVTISLPEDVYRAARVRAAEAGTSLSAMVSGYLSSLGGREERFSRLQAQQDQVLDEVERFSARDRLDRDELHQRGGASKQSKSGSPAPRAKTKHSRRAVR